MISGLGENFSAEGLKTIVYVDENLGREVTSTTTPPPFLSLREI